MLDIFTEYSLMNAPSFINDLPLLKKNLPYFVEEEGYFYIDKEEKIRKLR